LQSDGPKAKLGVHTQVSLRRTRILLADDHPAILNKIVTLLESSYEIVGIVHDGRAAVENAMRLVPDVILMDISMPLLTGIDAAEYLIRKKTKSKIVFLTVHNTGDFVRAALSTGAAGYVIKSHMATDLIPAIQEALAGHRFVSPCVLAKDARTG